MRLWLAAPVAVFVLAIAAPGAWAQATDETTLTPSSHDFGSQPVGASSPAKAFTLTQTCVPLCVVPDQFFPNISVTGRLRPDE